MKRVILDTNIYGRIVEKREADTIKYLLEKRPDVIIYGFDAVRKELRDLSQEVVSGRERIRLVLLSLYDRLVKSHAYYTTSLVKQLAHDYSRAYDELGGKKSEKMFNDFLVVACASIHELDIIVSDDRKTVLNETAVKCYKIINGLKGYRVPEFIDYEKFRRLLSS